MVVADLSPIAENNAKLVTVQNANQTVRFLSFSLLFVFSCSHDIVSFSFSLISVFRFLSHRILSASSFIFFRFDLFSGEEMIERTAQMNTEVSENNDQQLDSMPVDYDNSCGLCCDLLHQRAQALDLTGNYRGVMMDVNELLKMNPRDIGALLLRANFHELQGRREKCIADLNLVIEFDPLNLRAFAHHPRMFFDQGNREAALADFDHVLSVNPHHYYGLLG